jgi:hypothetical protein
MNGIGGISAEGLGSAFASAAVRRQALSQAQAAKSADADGDHDGTRVGQSDERAFGKGLTIDRMG